MFLIKKKKRRKNCLFLKKKGVDNNSKAKLKVLRVKLQLVLGKCWDLMPQSGLNVSVCPFFKAKNRDLKLPVPPPHFFSPSFCC